MEQDTKALVVSAPGELAVGRAVALGSVTHPDPTAAHHCFSVDDLSFTPQPCPLSTPKISLPAAVSLMPQARHSLLRL